MQKEKYKHIGLDCARKHMMLSDSALSRGTRETMVKPAMDLGDDYSQTKERSNPNPPR